MSISNHLLGVILKEVNVKESDKIITFYSQEQGKVEILVQGARKLNSKLNPIISARFTILDLVVIQGKNFYRLIDGVASERFERLIKDYQKILLLNNILKKVDQLLTFQKSDQEISSLIFEFLRRMDNLPIKKALPLAAAFLIKFLAFVGYCPELKHCSVCQKDPSSERIFFDLSTGSIICHNHRSSPWAEDTSMEIGSGCLNVLRILLYKDFNYLEKCNFRKQEFLKAWGLINQFLKWQVG